MTDFNTISDPLSIDEIPHEASFHASEYTTISGESFQVASRRLLHQRPNVPLSQLSVAKDKPGAVSTKPHSLSPIDASRGKSLTRHKRRVSRYIPPSEVLMKSCHQGWNYSKGLSKRPVAGQIDNSIVEENIKSFADRYKQGAGKVIKGVSLSSFGERMDPAVWPNRETVHFVRANPSTSTLNLSPEHPRPETPGPKYVPSTTSLQHTHSFTRSPRMPDEPPRSPGGIYDIKPVAKRAPSPCLSNSGRQLAGSIYSDQFNLKSSGNYYQSLEAYLTHSSSCVHSSILLPPTFEQEKRSKTRAKLERVNFNRNPMAKVILARSSSSSSQPSVLRSKS